MGSVEHRSGLLEGDDGMLEVLVAGEGPAVVMIPSLGRLAGGSRRPGTPLSVLSRAVSGGARPPATEWRG